MSTAVARFPRLPVPEWSTLAPYLIAGLAFCVLFRGAAATLVADWWHDPNAGHGLLLAPVAVYLAWQRGISKRASPQPALGLVVLIAAVVLRYVSDLAAEMFSMRISMLMAAAGIVVWAWGARQFVHWWLPVSLLVLSVPLPAVVLESLALPLQLQASEMGAALLRWRQVPLQLSGNVILLPGHSLFVTEACSGLRSLTALISLGLLMAGLALRTPVARLLLVAVAIPIAVFLNGVRVFLIGFLVYYVDPRLGEGLLHYTEGWFIFIVAFMLLGVCAWVLMGAERALGGQR